jgi:polyhydroxybutyrate depolymerase
MLVVASLVCSAEAQQPQPQSAIAGRCALGPGPQVREIEAAGLERSYRLRVGSAVGPEGRAPLVFAWHGFGGSADRFEGVIRPDRDWPEAIVVTPRGNSRRFSRFGPVSRPGWQTAEGELRDRDLAFFDAMLAELSSTGCVDPARVYSTGFSNGAFFSNLLGCVRGDLLAGIAPVAGGGPLGAQCKGPMPVLLTHGESDRVVPYASSESSLEHWAKQNSCSLRAPERDRCVALSDCTAAPAEFCSHAAGHVWPSGTTTRVVDFFRRAGSRR